MRIIFYFFVSLFLVVSPQGYAQTNLSYSGQMEISAFPLNKQICERQKGLSTAKVKIAGMVASSSNYDKIKLKVLEDTTGILSEAEVTLNYVGDSASFEITYILPANFINHQFTLLGVEGANETVEWVTDNVVAGDIFVINGQSNAQAYLSAMPEDIVPYTRSFHANQWDDLEHSFPGRWGAHLAKVMAEYLGFPVGVFNFADGAQPIDYFKANPQDANSNYSQMLVRLGKAGVSSPVATFWFHGEANGWDTPMESYYQSYDTLFNSWKGDFGIEGAFIFQVRRLGCSHPNPDIFEAQRLLAEQKPEIHIMSTTNTDHDSCHYRWEDGYRTLADRMALVVQNSIYNQSIPDQDFAPNVKKVELFSANTLRITFEPAGVPLNVIGTPGFDFRHEESEKRATDVWTLGDTLVVQFDTTLNVGEHFSYLSHPGPTPDWVVTPSGVGILEFYNHPIVDYVVSNESLAQNTKLTIAPNPSNGLYNIDWLDSENVDISIIDALGRVAWQQTKYAQPNIQINLSHLPKGMYQVVVKSPTSHQVGQLIKN